MEVIVAEDDFGQRWNGGDIPECGEEVLHCVFLPISHEMLFVVRVENRGMSYH
jgi:hypothetical protein